MVRPVRARTISGREATGSRFETDIMPPGEICSFECLVLSPLSAGRGRAEPRPDPERSAGSSVETESVFRHSIDNVIPICAYA